MTTDRLPTEIEYADTGCDIHDRCLTCPLVRCRYDERGGIASIRRREVGREAARLREEGKTVDEVAAALGISRRSVHRAGRAS